MQWKIRAGCWGFCLSAAVTAAAAPAASEAVAPIPIVKPPPPAAVQNVAGTALQAMLDAALEQVEAGDLAGAVPKLEAVIEQNPACVAAWLALGWSYWNLKRPDDAVRLWETWLKLEPRAAAAHNALGAAALGRGDLESAREHFQRSIEIDPHDPDTRMHLAWILKWSGDIDGAIAILRALQQEVPDRNDVVLELARALTEGGRYAEAAPLWRQMTGLAADNKEYASSLELCLAMEGDGSERAGHAQRALELAPKNPLALEVLAVTEESSPDPYRAAPYLRRLIEEYPYAFQQDYARTRLIRLLIRLHGRDHLRYPLTEAVDLARQEVQRQPDNPEPRLLLAELLMMDRKTEEAQRILRDVVAGPGARNLRAHKGLFEADLGLKWMSEAREQLSWLERFDPRNPYLPYYHVRYESTRGGFYDVLENLRELERAGRCPSVAVLKYPGVRSQVQFSDTMTVDCLREHIRAFRAAGFRFVTPGELPERMRTRTDAPRPFPGRSPRTERALMMVFDDLDPETLRLGAEVALEAGVTLVQLSSPERLLKEHPEAVSWDALARYEKEGRWVFGCDLDKNAHAAAPLTGDPLPSGQLKVWIPVRPSSETRAAFAQRFAAEQQRILAACPTQAPSNAPPPAAAAPAAPPVTAPTVATAPAAPPAQEPAVATAPAPAPAPEPAAAADGAAAPGAPAGADFMAFLPTEFGYAVSCADPRFYQYQSVDAALAPTAMVERVCDNHPLFLTLRQRAQFAAFNDRIYLASDTLREMEADGYPKGQLQSLRTYVQAHLSRRYGSIVPEGEAAPQQPFHFHLSDPYLGAEGLYHIDSEDRSNWELRGHAGLQLSPSVGLEGLAGIGRLLQNNIATNVPSPSPDLAVDEQVVGVRGRVSFPNGLLLSGQLLSRTYGAPADTTATGLSLEGQLRPLPPLDLLLRYESDGVPSALGAVGNITYDAYRGHGLYRLTDEWVLDASAANYSFSDDNTRQHWMVGTRWRFWERPGGFVGLRYRYASADLYSPVYWTPYQLNTYMGELGFEGNRFGAFYHLSLALGYGKEEVRPDTQRDYDTLVANAQRWHYDPGPSPEQDWQLVVAVVGATTVPLGRHWEAHGELVYNRSPNYDEFDALGGVRYKF